MTARAQRSQAPIDLLPGARITLVLAADGSCWGHGGCNTYQGVFTSSSANPDCRSCAQTSDSQGLLRHFGPVGDHDFDGEVGRGMVHLFGNDGQAVRLHHG